MIRLRRLTPNDRPSQWADRYAAGAELAPGDRLGRHHAPGEWLYTGIRGPNASTMFDTNLRVGERGELTIISFAGSATDLTVSVTYDGAEIFESAVTVADSYRETVAYEPGEAGTHTVTVRFTVDDDCVDTRYLKVFVQD